MKTKWLKPLLLTAAVLTTLWCLGLWSVVATSAADTPRVYDTQANLITEADEAALTAQLDALSEEYGVDFYLATYQAKNHSDDFYGNDYCREVEDISRVDAVLLIITYDLSDRTYYYDIYTYGKPNGTISDKEVNYILDNGAVYDNIKSGRLAEGASAFFDLSAKGHEGRVGVSYLIIASVCAVLGALIGFLVALSVARSYKRKFHAVDYPLDRFAKLELLSQSDTFTGTTTTRTYSPRSKGGGGGGGGGSTHGGGGGHRGGR